MSNPFTNLRLQPSFIDMSVVVLWDVPESLIGASYYVYRSETGLPKTWELLNEYAPVSHGKGCWVDSQARQPRPGATLYYRLCCVEANGTEHDSPVVDLFSVLPREQFGLVRQAIWEEYTQMRHGGGIQVAHCIPLQSGIPASNIDPETRQPTSQPCPGENTYGLMFQGGFDTPVFTWAKIITQTPELVDMDNGEGVDFRHDIVFRMLAYPRPSKGHMIVNPRTDERWIAGPNVKPYMLRGVVPTAWTVPCIRINREDLRHEFPVPFDSKQWP